MIRNSKVTGKATSVPIGLLAGLLMSLLITVSCSAVLAIMMVGGGLSIRSIGWWALIVVWLSSIFGALTTGLMVKRRALLVCMAAGAVYFASLLIIDIAFFGGVSEGVWTVLVSIVLASAVVGMTLARAGAKNGRRYPRRRYR